MSGSGDKAVDRQSSVRRALRLVVLAGTDLLQTARLWEKSIAADVVEPKLQGLT